MATQILLRAGWDQVGVQDRLNDVLQPIMALHRVPWQHSACVMSSVMQVSGESHWLEAAPVRHRSYRSDCRMRKEEDVFRIGDNNPANVRSDHCGN
jgi:hypothetical protein